MAIILSSEKNAFVLFLKYDAKSNLAFSLLLELTLSLPTVLYSWLQTVSVHFWLDSCCCLTALSTDEE